MKTSPGAAPPPEPRPELVVRSVEILTAEDWDALSCDTDAEDARECADLTSAFVSAEDISVTCVPWEESQASLTSPPSSEVCEARRAGGRADAWAECSLSPPEEMETAAACEPSDVYYTASSEVSLHSDSEERGGREEREEGGRCTLGHVAAMRERFESMTRANTPCPEVARSASPSLDVFRNVTPSPDRLG